MRSRSSSASRSREKGRAPKGGQRSSRLKKAQKTTTHTLTLYQGA
jgi:hypothetical protein